MGRLYVSGELKFNYLKRPYIVNMGSYLMGVLLSFNSNPDQAFADLASSTGLPEKELLRLLTSLCETKILLAEVRTLHYIRSDSIIFLSQCNAREIRAALPGESEQP